MDGCPHVCCRAAAGNGAEVTAEEGAIQSLELASRELTESCREKVAAFEAAEADRMEVCA
jgi:hypothetical protein